ALVEYGLISATPQTDARGDAAPTVYRLRMAGEDGGPMNRPPTTNGPTGGPMNRLPQSNDRTTSGPTAGLPVVQQLDPQETVIQETATQEEGDTTATKQSEADHLRYSPWIAQVTMDHSAELGDRANSAAN